MNSGECEICGFNNKKAIHKHHVVPRTDPRSTNDISNLAFICANCHNLVHAGQIIIEGRYFTTAGHKLFFHKKDESPVVRGGVYLLNDGTADIRD